MRRPIFQMVLQLILNDSANNNIIKHVMKRNILFILYCFVAFSLHAAEVNYLTVQVKGPGQLGQVLGDQATKIDSLQIIGGPIDVSDFRIIWEASFYGNLTSLNLEHALIKNKSIPDFALYDVQEQYIKPGHTVYLPLHRIILPENIEHIGKYAFARMELDDINIPSSIKSFDSGSFMSCHWLSKDKFIIPEGVTEIPYLCFQHCQSIKEFVLPTTLKAIIGGAFENTRMERINFPDGLESIGMAAFQGSGELKEAILPESCLNIQDFAFSLCDSLRFVQIPKGLKRIPANFVSYSNVLEEVTLPNGITEIGSDAFSICTKLHKINLPEGLQKIEARAFSYCNLDSLILPTTLLEIGSQCFTDGIQGNVLSTSTTPPTCLKPELPFGQMYHLSNTLYVPIGSADAYRSAWGWSEFNKIVETDFKFLSEAKDTVDAYDILPSFECHSDVGSIIIDTSYMDGIHYDVYTTDGCEIASGTINSTTMTIYVSPGAYIVKVGSTSRKLMVSCS